MDQPASLTREERIAARQQRIAAKSKQADKLINKPNSTANNNNSKTQQNTSSTTTATNNDINTTQSRQANNEHHYNLDTLKANATAQQQQQQQANQPVHNATSTSSSHLSPRSTIQSTRQTVDELKTAALHSVDDIALKRQHFELKRRQNTQLIKKERMKRIDDSTEQFKQSNAELSVKWNQLLSESDPSSPASVHAVPRDVYAAIAAQYKAATQLLQQQDELLQHLTQQLKGKEEEYVELLSEQQAAVEDMLQRMRQQWTAFTSTLTTELQRAEDSFLTERQSLIQQHRLELQSLFQQQRKLEFSILEQHSTSEKQYLLEYELIRRRDESDYQSLKIQLERNIETFQSQLEEMRAVYLLNTEKLDYNFSILSERGSENKRQMEVLRNKQRRLKEILSNLKHKFQLQDSQSQHFNQQLSQDYSRLCSTYKTLQKKYTHFINIDQHKYQQVEAMNRQLLLELAQKVLKSQKIVQEQILQQPFVFCPPHTFIQHIKQEEAEQGNDKNSTATGVTWINSAAGLQTADCTAMLKGSNGEVDFNRLTLEMLTGEASNSSLIESNVSTFADVKADASLVNRQGKYSVEQIKHVMELLLSEVDFLINQTIEATKRKIQEHIHNHDQEGEEAKVPDSNPSSSASQSVESASRLFDQLDSLLTALGIEDSEDLQVLVQQFYEAAAKAEQQQHKPNNNQQQQQDNKNNRNQQQSRENKNFTPTTESAAFPSSPITSSSTSASASLLSFLHPNDVQRVFREFIEQRSAANQQQQSNKNQSQPFNKDSNHFVLQARKQREKSRQQHFWLCLTHILSPNQQLILKTLEQWQGKYNLLLDQRQQALDEIQTLQQQNQEMKQLLQQYLKSEVVAELILPPTQQLAASKKANKTKTTQNNEHSN